MPPKVTKRTAARPGSKRAVRGRAAAAAATAKVQEEAEVKEEVRVEEENPAVDMEEKETKPEERAMTEAAEKEDDSAKNENMAGGNRQRGKGKAAGTGRAKKSLRISHSGVPDEPDARYTKNRRVNVSGRRGDRSMVQIHSPNVSSTGGYDFVDSSYDYVDSSSSSSFSHDYTVSATCGLGCSNEEDTYSSIPEGSDNRFVSTGSSGEVRARAPEDTFVLVTNDLLGGPRVGSVIPSFLGHVAYPMWMDKVYRGELKCHILSHACERLTTWLRKLPYNCRQQIEATGLSHLPSVMYRHIDSQLISAFVERWQPDTNTFHMPFGEMTITLHDVWEILRIPVEGQLVSATRSVDVLKVLVGELLSVSEDEMAAHWRSESVVVESIFRRCSGMEVDEETQTIAWMFVMFGATIFVNNSGIRSSDLLEITDGLVTADGFDIVHRYSWGSAALAYLYRQLGVASRGGCTQIAGCLTLLQAWIYEYFPCFRPQQKRTKMRSGMPRAAMWHVMSQGGDRGRLASLRLRIDQLTASEVCWLPYYPEPASIVPRTAYMGWIQSREVIEPYMPVRVVRQFGYVQIIPPPIFRPEFAYRPWNSNLYKVLFTSSVVADAWNVFPYSNMLVLDMFGSAADDPTRSVDDYIVWYHRHSRPQLVYKGAILSVPPRSDSDYWVDRSIRIQRNMIGRLKHINPDLAAQWTQELEDYMRDWSLSR